MKVFVTGPEIADSFTHNVAHAFREMGHEVRTESGVAFSMRQSVLGRVLGELLERASPRWRARREAGAVRIAREFKPDLTLMCTRTFEPDSVDTIRRVSGGRVVLWYGDAPANLKRDHVVSGEYDAVFAKDPDLVRRLKEMLGLDAHPLAEACNPSWHRPVAQRRGNTLVVAGSSYGYRNALVRRLLAAGEQVKLYGPPPSIWVPRDVAAAHTNRFLDQDTKAQVFGEALACLTSFALSEGANSVNCRVFETCACGAVALAEEREAIGRYFERDREYLAYGSMEECLEQLARLRADKSGARELRRRASERAHGEHTYRHRLESMLATLDLEPR